LIKGLLILIQERFPLVQYGPMILFFTLANAMYLKSESGLSIQGLSLALVLLLSGFLRLRLFDEIKDYHVDLKFNPTRPLARGVLSVDQTKIGILFLILLELVISASLGLPVFLIHILAIGFSLMMFEEFFIGTYLRPHLTTYAITHTFVSVLFAVTAYVASQSQPDIQFEFTTVLFLLSNWAYFNLFEFARKTYAQTEEKSEVPSYSKIFSVKGSVALSFSQVIIGLILLQNTLVLTSINPLMVLASLYLIVCLAFAFKPNITTAKLYRNLSGLYLLVHYILLSYALGKDLL
jgi:4-hydroxybenzoate polyprenyltransferase